MDATTTAFVGSPPLPTAACTMTLSVDFMTQIHNSVIMEGSIESSDNAWCIMAPASVDT